MWVAGKGSIMGLLGDTEWVESFVCDSVVCEGSAGGSAAGAWPELAAVDSGMADRRDAVWTLENIVMEPNCLAGGQLLELY